MISFILFITVNITVFMLVKHYYGNKYSTLSQTAICSLIFYVLAVIWAFGTSIYLKHQLETFDLDHDGFFSLDEQTSEQQKLMREVTSDLGRNLAPITGIFFSSFYFIFLLIGQYFYITIKKLIEKHYSKYQQSL